MARSLTRFNLCGGYVAHVSGGSWRPSGRSPDRGPITAANVIAGSMAPQQLAAGDLAAVVAAIRAGAAYANVHTTPSPGGEIRGQIRVIAK